MAQVFACEFCEISKNIFFTEHLWATAPVAYLVMFLFAYFNTNILYSFISFCTLLQSIYFRMFGPKHWITFEKTYLLNCYFTVLALFYINFRFSLWNFHSNKFRDWNFIETLFEVLFYVIPMYGLGYYKFRCSVHPVSLSRVST